MKDKIKQLIIRFGKGLFKVIGKLLYWLFDELRETLTELFERLTKEDHTDASFGKETNIAGRGEKGFVISQNRRMPLNKSFENVVLLGQIGSGKTTRFITPNALSLAQQDCSMIINDPAHQVWKASSGHAFNNGKRILILNWSKPEISVGFNFLILCRNYADVKRMADVLTRATFKDSNGDVFWQTQAKMVLAVFAGLVLEQTDESLHHMLNVSHLIALHTTAQHELLDDLITRCDNDKLVLDYMALSAMPEKTKQNVMASVATVLEVFDDPQIALVVCVSKESNLDFKELRKTPTMLYIQNSVGSNQGYLNVLNSVFYEMMFSSFLEAMPKEEELDVFIIYEELSSLFIPLLPSFLANNRKHRIANFLCLQSISQLEHYKHDKLNITANCVTTIVLPGDHPTQFLQEIQTKSGTVSYRDKEDKKHTKPLVPLSEFRLWPVDTALIIQGNQKMVKVRTKPFFKSAKYKKKASLQAVMPEQYILGSNPIKLIGQTVTEEQTAPIDNELKQTSDETK